MTSSLLTNHIKSLENLLWDCSPLYHLATLDITHVRKKKIKLSLLSWFQYFWSREASDQKLEAGTAWERGYQLL